MPLDRTALVRVTIMLILVNVACCCGWTTASAAPQAAGTSCSPTDYKIVTPYFLAILCGNKAPTQVPDGGQLFLVSKTGQSKEITASMNVQLQSSFLIVDWQSSGETDLQPKTNYVLTLRYASGTSPLTISIDTTDTVTLAAPQSSRPLRFVVTSHVAFADNSRRPLYTPPLPMVKWSDCSIPTKSAISTTTKLNAQCSDLVAPFNAAAPSPAQLSQLDFHNVGRRWIELKSLPGTPITPLSMPGSDIFGTTPTFDPKSRFARQAAPATKDAAQIYLDVNYAAGVGTLPAWILDAKYASPFGMWNQFQLAPLLLANIGNNTIKGQTYTNTIDLGGTAQRVFRAGNVLPLIALATGINYETDKQFDRDNLLATVDSQYFFHGLYNTQQQEALRIYYDRSQKDSAYQLTDVAPPILGYQLDFHAGIEAGGALANTTVHASKGSAEETLPQYPIFRVVPQVHGLLQLWKFSFDESFVGRYLAVRENTIVQLPNNALLLKEVQGWRGISTFTSTFAMDPQGHFNITLVFKDGFAPPTYLRVNAVQGGVLIKY